MAMPFFVWKNIDSRNRGIVVNEYPPIVKPKERTTDVTIPGRSGTLTLKEGENVYENMVRTCQCTALPTANIATLCDWLRGGGTVRFGNEPAYVYKARLDGQVDLNRLLRGFAHRVFALPFVCQPGKYLASPGADLVIASSGTAIYNPGTLPSEPVIQLEGSGNIALSIGGSYVELENISGGIIIDSAMKDCLNLTRSGLLNEQMTGDFPLIVPGAGTVSWTGSVSRIVITPNWRWL